MYQSVARLSGTAFTVSIPKGTPSFIRPEFVEWQHVSENETARLSATAVSGLSND